MIARIAARAIWRPKLDDTFVTPSDLAFTLLSRSPVSVFCSRGAQLLEPDLEAAVALGAGHLAAALDDGIATADRRRLRADLRERRRLVGLERDLHAALEVDAEVQPAHARARTLR